MPLVHSENITEDCRLMVWELTETEEILRNSLPTLVDTEELSTITHPQKKREWLAGRLLISQLVRAAGKTFGGIWKDEHGKPFLRDSSHYISLTHTLHYIAAVIHPSLPIGIDMEKKDEKLIRTASKYMSTNELELAPQKLEDYCIYWCAKEAIFKLNGRKKVSFRDNIRVHSVDTHTAQASGELFDRGQKVTARFYIRWIGDYCLVVAT